MADYRDDKDFALWQSYEDAAKHFNELLIRLRTQALGGLAGVVALSGFALNFTQKPATCEQWQVLFGTALFFLIAWGALAILDLGYYDKLLWGAVVAIIEHERRTPALVAHGGAPTKWDEITKLRPALAALELEAREVNFSTIVAAMVPGHASRIKQFYSVVAVGLLLVVGATGFKAFCCAPEANTNTIESKFDRAPGERVRFIVDPPAGSQSAQSGNSPQSAD